VKYIESQTKWIMRWHNALCRIVGFKQWVYRRKFNIYSRELAYWIMRI
jgi:type II secretory pathway component PulF